jgi:hypothetical protein
MWIHLGNLWITSADAGVEMHWCVTYSEFSESSLTTDRRSVSGNIRKR